MKNLEIHGGISLAKLTKPRVQTNFKMPVKILHFLPNRLSFMIVIGQGVNHLHDLLTSVSRLLYL